jgi:CheY-like chemotaxis protein
VRIINAQKKFGISIRGWRDQLGISQEELATRSNLHRTYISDVERGTRNISLENITKLAVALDISVSALFPEEIRIEGGGHTSGSKSGQKLVDILLVEDNPDDVELTLQGFKKSRFANQVHVVRDGAEALDFLFCRNDYAVRRAMENPQLVLLDLNLPKISGLEVLRRIKAEPLTRTIPVAVLTVSQMFSDLKECQRLGAETYIVKPVNFHRLSQVTPHLNLDWALFKSRMLESPNGRA